MPLTQQLTQAQTHHLHTDHRVLLHLVLSHEVLFARLILGNDWLRLSQWFTGHL